MDPFPDFRIKGKELVIDFNDSLRSNTTYTINISAAVKDITENNVLPDFQYVFSTGDYIDSFYFTGRVVDAEKGELAEGVDPLVVSELLSAYAWQVTLTGRPPPPRSEIETVVRHILGPVAK